MVGKILTPTDLSAASKGEIAYAISLARERDCELVVVHATSIPAYELGRFYGEDFFLSRRPFSFSLDHLTRRASADLRHFIYGHFLGDLEQLEWKIRIELGEVAEAIVSAACREEAGLIVMGKRKRKWLQVPSRRISERVIRKAPCPVLCVSPQMALRPWGAQRIPIVDRAARPRLAGRPRSTMPIRILVVEDHVDSLELLSLQLTSMGYEVIGAMTGKEGIEKAQAHHPEIIVMDLGLPDINGIEATQRLKHNPHTARIPVIGHTAWPEEAYKNAGKKAGISEVLTKPTDPTRFKTAIERHLNLN
ncbi:MAG: response regulator [Deltaproteobacteria bacterium]|nr:response regulator [Deltaproteobacteria bacterium]MBI3060472.1 response regulator [Deltaproteobacteria bacterium]